MTGAWQVGDLGMWSRSAGAHGSWRSQICQADERPRFHDLPHQLRDILNKPGGSR